MSKTVERIRVDMRKWNDFMTEVKPILDAWPDNKREAFAEFWWDLEDAGCEAAETVFHDGAVYCAPSDDFRRALAEFGVVVE
jgi:hypothetical protein